MITQTGNRSCRRGRDSLFRIAIGAMILSMSSCAEIEVGAEAYKIFARAKEQPPGPLVLPDPARQDSIDPSMHPDPEAFHAADLALWDGARTLSGIWIAHPMAETARRVRLTNGETGARVDAAMFRRDPNLSGPRIIVSSEAAERLGLTPGHSTPITIEGLAFRSGTDAAAVVAGAAEEPAPAPVDGPAEVAASESGAARVAAVSPPPPAAPEEPAPADGVPPDAAAADETDAAPAWSAASVANAAAAGGTEPTPEEAQLVASTPVPQPEARPGAPAPAPDGDGNITDGRHFIQAGVFSQPENAARLVEKLCAADLPASELPLILGEWQFTRVLVGPYRTIAERDSALETVRKLGPAVATPVRG